MSRTVVVQETAIRALARIRSEDKDAFAQIGQAMSALVSLPEQTEFAVCRGCRMWFTVVSLPGGPAGPARKCEFLPGDRRFVCSFGCYNPMPLSLS